MGDHIIIYYPEFMSHRIYYLQSIFKSMQEDILEKAKNLSQEHLVEHYNSISDPTLASNFLNQLKNVDF